MDLSAINEVENLHHHKGIEDKSKMPRIYPSIVVDSLIVLASSNGNKTTAPNVASDFPIFPLPLRMASKCRLIESISIFWDKEFSSEDQCNHDGKLKYSLSNYMFHHLV